MVADRRAEQGLALLRQGYDWAPRLRARTPDGVAATRLAGRRALVVAGAEGARLFYDESRVRRRGAVPAPVKNTLFGKGAVHGLDDEQHRRRKAVFLALLDADAVAAVVSCVGEQWQRTSRTWRPGAVVEVFDESVHMLGLGMMSWLGLTTPVAERPARARELAQVVDGFGSLGIRGVRARLARMSTERWLRGEIRAARSSPAEVSPVQVVAGWLDEEEPLDERTAAVELHNLVRPTVAVAWLIAYGAVALSGSPELAARLVDADRPGLEAFAHEVRRRYPFVPLLAARARVSFDWQGHDVRRGDQIILDVYGTDMDPDRYPCPATLDIERWQGAPPDAFSFVPQGGGDVRTGHRCPGEQLAVELLIDATRRLSRAVVNEEIELRPGPPISDRRLPPRPRPRLTVLRTSGAAAPPL